MSSTGTHPEKQFDSDTRLAARIHDWLLGHRLLVGVVLLLLTAAMAAGGTRLVFDNSYRIWIMEDDPALLAYDELLSRFGSDEAMVLALQTHGDPFSVPTLRTVERLSVALSRLPGVLKVWSLTHMDAMVDTGGSIEMRRLIDRIPPSPQVVARARALVRASPLYRLLVSKDERTTALLLKLEQTRGSFDKKSRLVQKVRALAARIAPGRTVHLAGSPVWDEAMYRYSERDTLLFLPLVCAVMLVTLAWLFRSVVAVAAPMLVAVLALAWSLGLMGWAGWDANIVTNLLPPLLAAVAIADTIHLLQQLRLFGRRGLEVPAALRQAFIQVLRPCLLTSVTTAAGMASLVAATLPAIRELGLAAAAGVMAAFLLTMAGLPVLLSLLPPRWLGGLVTDEREPAPRWLVRCIELATRRSRAVVAVAALALVAALLGLPRLPVGNTMTSYFFESDPVYQESLAADRALGGTMPLEVLVQARGDRDLLEPRALARMELVARYLQTLPATGQVHSGLDLLKEARRVLLGQAPGTVALPASREEAAQLLLLLEGQDEMDRFLSMDRRQARIEVFIAGTSYEELVGDLERIERDLARLGGQVLEVHVTGLVRLLADMEDYLLESQVRSFGLAFLLVMGFIALLFRSLRAGLLSAVPNLLPLALTLGLMGWAAIRLDAITMMAAPLLLGIVVDDTVHMLERVLAERARGVPVDRAFCIAGTEVGHAVLLTTVVLILSFLTLLLGSFKPNFYFAVLSAFSLVAALAADLLVFPAVACLFPWLVPVNRPHTAGNAREALELLGGGKQEEREP